MSLDSEASFCMSREDVIEMGSKCIDLVEEKIPYPKTYKTLSREHFSAGSTSKYFFSSNQIL